MRWLALLLIAVSSATACSRGSRQYPIRGQILQIGPDRPDGAAEVSVHQEDIPGFMSAMTMAYLVKSRNVVQGFTPGDLFAGTLVIEGNDMYLTALSRTGHAPLPAGAKPVKIMDVMEPGSVVPDDAVIDQQGALRHLSDWRGRALAVTFVYTRCPQPDFCPLMDRRFQELQRAIAADAGLRDRIHLVSVSFDPEYDTPAVIRRHASARGVDPRTWSYVTGAPDAIAHMTSRFGVSTIDARDAPGTITHNLRTAVVDRKGRLVTIYTGSGWTVDGLLADLRDASGR